MYMSFAMPITVRDAGGNVVYQGAIQAGKVFMVKNTGAAAITPGTAVKVDPVLTVVPRWDLVYGTDARPTELMAGKAVAAAADVGFLGVALEKIPVLGTGQVAGVGSLVSVAVTATLIAIGTAIIGSATPAFCAASATPAIGTTLGNCYQINTVASPGTGSTGQAVVLVCPR